jgi:RNA polymerase sigma-70 factor (ECF subfamily)
VDEGSGLEGMAAPGGEENTASAGGGLEGLIAAVARDRDRAAFTELFRYFAPRVEAYCLRLGASRQVAEETVQEAMLAVWRRAHQFDPAIAPAAAWVFAIARNGFIDRIRREARPEPDPEDPLFRRPPQGTPEEAAVEEQSRRFLLSAIETLPPDQSEILRLSYFEWRSHSEVAEVLGIPLGTVKTRIRLALTRLRRTIGETA